jgi:hypothetical protein
MTWTLFGRETSNPLAIAFIIVMLLLIVPATSIPHLAARIMGGDGFLRDGNNYEPGAFWTITSNVVLYGLLLVLVIL